jgi:hypothetical protein
MRARLFDVVLAALLACLFVLLAGLAQDMLADHSDPSQQMTR